MFLLHNFIPYLISLYFLSSIRLFNDIVELSFAFTSTGINEPISLKKKSCTDNFYIVSFPMIKNK